MSTIMAPHLGKRKRVTRAEVELASRSPTPSSASASDDEGDHVQALFRKAFEAKFAPLDGPVKKQRVERKAVVEEKSEEDEEDDGEESDWSGISSDCDSGPTVQVVEYTSTRSKSDTASKSEYRAYMVWNPPDRKSIV